MMIAKTTHRTLAISGVLLMTTSLFVFGYLPRYEYMFPVFGVGVGKHKYHWNTNFVKMMLLYYIQYVL